MSREKKSAPETTYYVNIGDVHGDIKDTIIAGRDVNITRLDPSDARNQRNHEALRKMVFSFWVDGVLKFSLYNGILIHLNMEYRSDAVDNRPWDLILQQPSQPDNAVPFGINIADVFDQMNQLLLILGEPGSGKTTLLLELARELLIRAEADLTLPTPVLFNLSTWSQRREPLAEWLVDELRTKYNIPNKLAEAWIENDELLLLLDGLDEVQHEYRDDCVTVINMFRQEHLVPLVVCCRAVEYTDLATQLHL
ncbi:NACHT domain-containing protein [Chloroflexi bacterium TSY]|nr:NACHT domain-containing protein [Chloroflexi bacterium TSY]